MSRATLELCLLHTAQFCVYACLWVWVCVKLWLLNPSSGKDPWLCFYRWCNLTWAQIIVWITAPSALLFFFSPPVWCLSCHHEHRELTMTSSQLIGYFCLFSSTDAFVNSQEWTLSRTVPELKVVSSYTCSLFILFYISTSCSDGLIAAASPPAGHCG